MSTLIIGCGYLGEHVARLCREDGDDVLALVHTLRRAAELSQAGFETVLADVTRPRTLNDLPVADRVLFCVGFPGNPGLSRWQVHVTGLHAVIDRLDPKRQRLVFVSTTGVMGDAAGEWVNDLSPCRPKRTVGRAFLEAEQSLQHHPVGRRSVVLRMAGIYGPGRIARLDDIRAGRPLDVAAENYVNLIHVEDAARIILAAWSRANTPATYLVSDGQPVYRRDFYRYLAELLNAPKPRFVDPAPENAGERHDSTNKRIDGRRVLEDLDIALTYPSYREGLAAVLSRERQGST